MKEREKLNKLVVFVLENRVVGAMPTAQEIFSAVRETNSKILREERVQGFRGFVQVLRGFEDINKVESKRPMRYKLLGNVS